MQTQDYYGYGAVGDLLQRLIWAGLLRPDLGKVLGVPPTDLCDRGVCRVLLVLPTRLHRAISDRIRMNRLRCCPSLPPRAYRQGAATSAGQRSAPLGNGTVRRIGAPRRLPDVDSRSTA